MATSGARQLVQKRALKKGHRSKEGEAFLVIGNGEGCAETLGDSDGELEGSTEGSDEGPEAVSAQLKLVVGLLGGDEKGCAERPGNPDGARQVAQARNLKKRTPAQTRIALTRRRGLRRKTWLPRWRARSKRLDRWLNEGPELVSALLKRGLLEGHEEGSVSNTIRHRWRARRLDRAWSRHGTWRRQAAQTRFDRSNEEGCVETRGNQDGELEGSVLVQKRTH